jgi:hypothetical protein
LFDDNIPKIGQVVFVLLNFCCISHNDDNTVVYLSSFCITVSVIFHHHRDILNISSAVASGLENILFLSDKYASYLALSEGSVIFCGLNVLLLNTA